MDELADLMIEEWRGSDEIMEATWMDEEELSERYLENWYSIKDTANELGIDESEVREYSRDSRDDYDNE